MTALPRPSARALPTLCAVLVGLLSLAAYASTMAPGLTWANDSADGGELAAAAYTLGIPHPPGYPTYVLLACPFAHLGLDTVAAGTNLLSALCAATAAGLVCCSVVLACSSTVPQAAQGSCWSGLAAGLLLACCPLHWSLGTVTEVHALNALFAALLLLLAIWSGHVPSPRRRQIPLAAALVGVAWGLALGNHPTALLIGGPLVAAVLIRLARMSSARAVLLPGLGGLALGSAVYLVLPLRAAADPALNWGDPRTPERFWYVVSALPYRGFLFGLPVAHLPGRLVVWAAVVVRQLTPVGLLLAALGAAALWRTARPLLTSGAAAFALCSAFAIGYNTTDSYQYLLPAVVLATFCSGVGLHRLALELAHRGGLAGRCARPLVWCACAGVLALAAVRYPSQDLGRDDTTLRFARATLFDVPEGAILVSRQDAHTFALWYYQQAEAMRPDVVVIDTGLLSERWYNQDVQERLGLPTGDDRLEELAAIGDGIAVPHPVAGRRVCLIEADAPAGPFGLRCAVR